MIITCPNCETSYQVADKAIGSAGRKVQCASCHESWQAMPQHNPPPQKPGPKLVEPNKTGSGPVASSGAQGGKNPGQNGSGDAGHRADDESDQIFSPKDEADLDRQFEREAGGAGAPSSAAGQKIGPPADDKTAQSTEDDALQQERVQAMLQRQNKFSAGLPVARLRRAARWFGTILVVVMLAGLYQFRTEIVRFAPDLSVIYEAAGMDINVVGLEFHDLETVRTVRDGSDLLIIGAKIVNVANRQVPVPPVVVTLLDKDGADLFEWSATPEVHALSAGESFAFETQVARAPQGFVRVRLTFGNSQSAGAGTGGAGATLPDEQAQKINEQAETTDTGEH